MNKVTRVDPFEDPLNNLFRGFFVRPVEMPEGAPQPSIKMDVAEQADAYLVHAELPGVKKEDIHVLVEGNQVSIQCEIRQQRETKEGERILRAERYFGKLSRAFQVAQEIDDTQSSARFNDGVLELRLPKRAAVSSKRLAID